jgi:hypothetical protein
MSERAEHVGITRIDIDDAIAMDDALDEWGGADDEHAGAFRSGWRTERTGCVMVVPEGEGARCAYLSGVIAAREAG